MRKNVIAAVVATALCLVPAGRALGQNWEGLWRNQRGSTLLIEDVDSEGRLTGIYVNRAQGTGCRDQPFPVSGWVIGTAVTFSVKWENAAMNCNSLTTWAGFGGTSTITTQWYLVVNRASNIQTGQDNFTRIATTEVQSPTAPGGGQPER